MEPLSRWMRSTVSSEMAWSPCGPEFLAITGNCQRMIALSSFLVPTPILPILAGIPCKPVRQLEERIPLAVRVDLCGLDLRYRSDEALTENVSSHGARVVSNNPWKPQDRLNLWCLRGDFRARVVYCEPLGPASFAIGLPCWPVRENGNSSATSSIDGPATFGGKPLEPSGKVPAAIRLAGSGRNRVDSSRAASQPESHLM